MAFGVERKWAKAFQDIYREPPTWYVGSTAGPFDLNGFSTPAGRPVEPDRERDELVAAQLGRIGIQRRVVGWRIGWGGRGRVLS